MNPIDQNSSFNGPLTPHRFKNSHHPSSQNTQGGQKSNNNSITRFVPLAIAGIALLILPITIWQINTQQDIRQQASTPDELPQQTIIARFNNEAITESDIDQEYTKQQNATTYTVAPSSLRSQLLNDVIKKKIILKEANEREIIVSEEEVDERIKILSYLGNTAATNRQLIKEHLLEEKLAVQIADSKNVNIIFSDNNLPQTRSFLELIREDAIDQGSVINAAEPFVRQSRDIYLYQDVSLTHNNPFFTPTVSVEVFELGSNEISEIIEDNNRFFIVEIVSETSGEYRTLEDFIQEQKDTLVQLI